MKEKNYIRFPDNIFEAEDISVDNEKYKLYLAMSKYGVSNFYVELLEDNIEYEKLIL